MKNILFFSQMIQKCNKPISQSLRKRDGKENGHDALKNIKIPENCCIKIIIFKFFFSLSFPLRWHRTGKTIKYVREFHMCVYTAPTKTCTFCCNRCVYCSPNDDTLNIVAIACENDLLNVILSILFSKAYTCLHSTQTLYHMQVLYSSFTLYFDLIYKMEKTDSRKWKKKNRIVLKSNVTFMINECATFNCVINDTVFFFFYFSNCICSNCMCNGH